MPLFTLLLILLLPVSAAAGEASIALELGAGVIAGALAREASQWIVAGVNGVRVRLHADDSISSYRQGSSREQKQIAIAGFAEQMITTEIILGLDAIPKDRPFVLGMLAWNLFNPILYAVMHETTGHNEGGSLAVLHREGVNTLALEGVMIAHALFSLYRLQGDPKFRLWFNADRADASFGLTMKF